MAKSPTYRGCYVGIGRRGSIERVYESFDRGAVTLHGGEFGSHHVMKGRQAQTEVVIVFGLTSVQYLPATLFGSETEKKIVADLEAKITGRGTEDD